MTGPCTGSCWEWLSIYAKSYAWLYKSSGSIAFYTSEPLILYSSDIADVYTGNGYVLLVPREMRWVSIKVYRPRTESLWFGLSRLEGGEVRAYIGSTRKPRRPEYRAYIAIYREGERPELPRSAPVYSLKGRGIVFEAGMMPPGTGPEGLYRSLVERIPAGEK